jgi:tRNA(Ser,Leu) C12 N-acetylase TAN1
MKIANRFFIVLTVLMVLPFVFMSCGDSFDEQLKNQLKEEMESLKSKCPEYQGDGVTIVDVNFYENEKILEFISLIEGVEYLGDDDVAEIKKTMVEIFRNDVSALEKFSIKVALNRGYRYRYIYSDVNGNKLCEIDITKDDLP